MRSERKLDALWRNPLGRSELVAFRMAHPPGKLVFFLLAACLLPLNQISGLESNALPSSTAGAETGGNAGTTTYAEPIKWNFGGWNPLEGNQPTGNSTTKRSNQIGATSSTPQMSSTEPLGLRNSSASSGRHQGEVELPQDKRSRQQAETRAVDSAGDDTASTNDKYQFALPVNAQQAQYQQQAQRHHMHPAYAGQFQREIPASSASQMAHLRPQGFSLPAPAPIVRDHVLPSQQHHYHFQGNHFQQQRPFEGRNLQQAAAFYREQHHQRMRQHQQKIEQNHRQQQYLRQQHFEGHAMKQQPGPMLSGPAPPNWLPFSGPPPTVRKVQHHHQMQASRPQVIHTSGFKVVEGEQPALFEMPLPQHPIQQAHHPGNDSAAYQSTASSVGFEHPTMSAIEKNNLNYNEALNQVNEAAYQHQQSYQQQQQHRPTNNIQDIKQRHLSGHDQRANANGNAQSHSNSSYLTIPVAVETEGDKVLTADDINEIEKHVIKVLPNLNTANKVVKLADTKLTMANLRAAAENHQHLQHPVLNDQHQANYRDHMATMQQLEADLSSQGPSSPGYVSQTTPNDSSYSTDSQQSNRQPSSTSSASLSQATTPSVEHRPSGVNDDHNQQQNYYMATGQLEPETDQEHGADYQLIKNDLLNSIRYEPTRSNANGRQLGYHQNSIQMSSKQPIQRRPISYQPPRHQGEPSASTVPMIHHSGPNFTPQTPPPTQPVVTRYFKQGHNPGGHQRPNGSSRQPLFGRLGGNQHQQHQPRQHQHQPMPTTRTIMGGRKVSEIMRQLIHTTPVPMTSPVHVPDVEPEKLDAIQLIAGRANDQRPVVVESHQLVNHTPDGGIDYNSGNPLVIDHQVPSTNGNSASVNHTADRPFEMQDQTHQSQASSTDYQSPRTTPIVIQHQHQPNQGAIIEYVAMTEQALNSANQHHQTTPQAYRISGQPELQTVYVNAEQPPENQAPQGYPTTTSDAQQQQQQQHVNVYPERQSGRAYEQATPPTVDFENTHDQAQGGGLTGGRQIVQFDKQHQQQAEVSQASLAQWSPSIASEHQQQQQLELVGEHAGPVQQLDMPATAGYNNIFNQADGRAVGQQSYEDGQRAMQPQQHRHQSNEAPDEGSKWRSKAGGSQPNPDAQYDGQIVKGSEEQESGENSQENQQSIEEQENQQRQQQQQQQAQLFSNYATAGDSNGAVNSDESVHDQSQQQQQQVRYQQEEQQQYAQDQAQQQQQHSANNGQDYVRPTDQDHHAMNTVEPNDKRTSPTADGYQLSSMSYTSSPQLDNLPEKSPYQVGRENYDGPQQHTSDNSGKFNYMKVDREAQKNHLAQQQALHQAHLAELMNNRETHTTVVPATTLATIQAGFVPEQQSDAGNSQDIGNNESNNSNGYANIEHDQQGLPGASSQSLGQADPSPLREASIMDKQSLLPDVNHYQIGDDDGSKQQEQSQPVVYQVYQAYYAPKDHRPLPGYVRLSIDEFNDLFRDAEIQYVDRNSNNHNRGPSESFNNLTAYEVPSPVGVEEHPYAQQSGARDPVKASSSELNQQTILIDRRSIGNTQRLKNQTDEDKHADLRAETRAGQKVRKIISIRNSRMLPTSLQALRQREDPPLLESSSTKQVVVKSLDAPFNGTVSIPKIKTNHHESSSNSTNGKLQSPKKSQHGGVPTGASKLKNELPKPKKQQQSINQSNPIDKSQSTTTGSKIPIRKSLTDRRDNNSRST